MKRDAVLSMLVVVAVLGNSKWEIVEASSGRQIWNILQRRQWEGTWRKSESRTDTTLTRLRRIPGHPRIHSCFTPSRSSLSLTLQKRLHWKSRGRFALGGQTDGREGDGGPLKTKTEETVPSSRVRGGLRFTQQQIDEIKSMADIVEVVEQYNLPKFVRRGDGATAQCPFHNDSSPSFSVQRSRGMYNCFACGAAGDVFNFVREYRRISTGTKMSFVEAVQLVAREFTDGTVLREAESASAKRSLNYDEKKMAELQKKRERAALANAAAASFYGNCLINLPAAGAARSHLRSRGISPSTTRTFALGFAPDAYYNRIPRDRPWGDGSLVNNLREMGFTADEIVDAGLATRSSGRSARNTDTNRTNASDDDDDGFALLMDRFRGRLVVPIFDQDGRTVLGFGGRILDNFAAPQDSPIKTAKYLNSPESVIFRKKTVLFGRHVAKEALEQARQERIRAISPPTAESDEDSFQPHPILPDGEKPFLLIVEGYVDALALHDAGIPEVTASMGATLSLEQMELAAKTVLQYNGRIILCLDNDAAGISAVERLCNGNILAQLSEKYPVEVEVAILPEGIKDPAEFIENRGGPGSKAGAAAFRLDVLSTTVPWTDWYIARVVDQYDEQASSGSSGSFTDVCERIATFLAHFANPADRTKRAFEASGKVADLLAASRKGEAVSPTLRVQLESDLLTMAARKARARDSFSRRIESVGDKTGDMTVRKMMSGLGFGSSADQLARKKRSSTPADDGETDNDKDAADVNALDGYGTDVEFRPRRKSSWKKRDIPEPMLTPHFSGFDFGNPSDSEWLGLKGRDRLVLGRSIASINQHGEVVQGKDTPWEDLVYFNSNEFLGNKFLTEEARAAGYSNDLVGRTTDVGEFGVPLLVEPDGKAILRNAEERLLRTLVQHPAARRAMKAAVDSSIHTGLGGGDTKLVEWSTPEREWLFQCLIEASGQGTLPADLKNKGASTALRAEFASRADAPAMAFSSESSNETSASVEVIIDKPTLEDQTVDAELVVSPVQNSDSDVAEDVDAILLEDERDDDTVVDKDGSGDGASLTSYPDDGVVPSDSVASSWDTSYSSEGTLERFFRPEEDPFQDYFKPTVAEELRVELTIQETWAVLLQATAVKRLAKLKAEWKEVATALERRKEAASDESCTAVDEESSAAADEEVKEDNIKKKEMKEIVVDPKFDSVELEDLEAMCADLAWRTSDALKTVQELDDSTKRIAYRLLDYCSGNTFQMMSSEDEAEKLEKMMEQHINSLPEDSELQDVDDVFVWKDDGPRYEFGNDDDDDDDEGRGILDKEEEEEEGVLPFDSLEDEHLQAAYGGQPMERDDEGNQDMNLVMIEEEVGPESEDYVDNDGAAVNYTSVLK